MNGKSVKAEQSFTLILRLRIDILSSCPHGVESLKIFENVF